MNLSEAAKVLNSKLEGYDGFWCVAGGWAIDFYLDRQTRDHEDLEIVVLRTEEKKLFRHFKRYYPQKIFSGEPPQFVPWEGDPIEPSVIQLRLQSLSSTEFDLLLSPFENGKWVCRRSEAIRRPLDQVTTWCKRGLPVLNPEIVLLFKAKYLREKDQLDFENVYPTIPIESREWLSAALESIYPGHVWAKPNQSSSR